MKKTVITVIVTFVLTTLFWYLAIHIISINSDNVNNKNQNDEFDEIIKSMDCSESIIGKWKAFEVAKGDLEFTKYGTMLYTTYDLFKTTEEYAYSISLNQVTLYRGSGNLNFTVKVITDQSGTYLEVHNITQLAGKYRKVD